MLNREKLVALALLQGILIDFFLIAAIKSQTFAVGQGYGKSCKFYNV